MHKSFLCTLLHGLSWYHWVYCAFLDASCGSHFYQDRVTDVIFNVLEDIHTIVNQFSEMSKRLVNTGVYFLNEVSGEKGDLTSTGSLDTADHIEQELCDISSPLDQNLENVQSTGLPNGPVKLCTVYMDDRNTREECSHEEARADSLYTTLGTVSNECLNVNNEVGEEKRQRKCRKSEEKRVKNWSW